MLNLKKTAVAVLAFGSSAVFAGTMGPVCTPGSVTVPCASSAWDFGVQALYLKPSLSGYGYQGSTYSDYIGLVPTRETYNNQPYNWGWGFKLEGSYHFNTGNDLNLNWYHFNHTTTNVVGVVPATATAAAITTTASVEPRWDAVNLEFGQHAHFGEWKNIRFHGGVQYASLRTNNDVTIDQPTFAQTASSTYLLGSDQKYNGFGPRIGADYWYNWGNGFSMYANGATALLVGTQSFTNTLQLVTAGVAGPLFTATGSKTAIVPELEGKLGVKYTYSMAQGDLGLDAGWMWVNYWDALHTGVGAGVTKETNLAFQGPFIGLKWVGNVA